MTKEAMKAKRNILKHEPMRLTHVQVIAAGFAVMILIGTLLLMLPIASRDGRPAPFRTALFTATSASCVTGLVLRDTVTGWSGFGQAVILIMIQIGGLGFMTVATFIYLLLRRRMGLRHREILVESINTTKVGGIMRLAKKIGVVTFAVEGLGAVLLSIRFVPLFGFFKGIWYGVFHSISAFCNAGFDLLGVYEPYGSFVPFAGDAFMNLVLIALITIGGLGFLVWDDLMTHRFHWKHYSLQTKVVLTVSAILTFGGALVLLLTEWQYTGAGLSGKDRVLTALFASVTARTAGFNTVDIAAMSESSRLVTLFLMLVGGSPGSTAGGVKTTTVAVIALFTFCSFRGKEKPEVFGRSISGVALKKACSVLFFNLTIALVSALLLVPLAGVSMDDALFETFSAVGTVGMTAGITRSLGVVGAYLVAFLMYLGRVGSISFSVAMLKRHEPAPVSYPEEKITVG